MNSTAAQMLSAVLGEPDKVPKTSRVAGVKVGPPSPPPVVTGADLKKVGPPSPPPVVTGADLETVGPPSPPPVVTGADLETVAETADVGKATSTVLAETPSAPELANLVMLPGTAATLDAVTATVNALVPAVNNHERLLLQMPTQPTHVETATQHFDLPKNGANAGEFNIAQFFVA